MLLLLSQTKTSAKILLTPRNTNQNTNQPAPVYGISIPIPAKLLVSKRYTTLVTKDVVGLLIGEVVSTKKIHIVAEDVVDLQVGDSKNNSLTKMKTINN
jgi:hypothetical protein